MCKKRCNMPRFIVCTLCIVFFAVQAQAYQTFFGEDLNNSSIAALLSHPQSSAASSSFLAALTGVGTESFEGFSLDTPAPLTLNFPGAGTATLTGGDGLIVSVAPESTNGFGRYATSGTSFWDVTAGADGNFVVTFLNPVAAFGFYGIDIGDFGGQLTVELTGGNIQNFTIPNTFGSEGYPDGSVLFWGVIGQNSSETFTSAAFNTTTGEGDVFAFDDMTIGSFEQVNPDASPTPEPPAIALIAAGILCLGLLRFARPKPALRLRYAAHNVRPKQVR